MSDVKVPDEGLGVVNQEYAKTLIFALVKESAGAVAEMAKPMVMKAMDELYARGLFIVRANDTAHFNYITKTLEEYEGKPHIRYPIVLRAIRAEDISKWENMVEEIAQSQQQPQAAPAVEEPPAVADLPQRG